MHNFRFNNFWKPFKIILDTLYKLLLMSIQFDQFIHQEKEPSFSVMQFVVEIS